jgi:hypothetical protein
VRSVYTLAVFDKETRHGVHVEGFTLKKLNEVEGMEEYHVEISNRFYLLG